MFSFAVISLGLALAPFAHAAIHDITVGGSNGQLEYNPQAIAAQPGDQVVFHFQQKNHTATQSSFADPCGPKDGGFNSGFMPVPANQTDNFPTYTVTVNDMNPIWVYCAQAAGTPNSHCGKGMVFAINCGADGAENSFTNFMNSALAVGASLAAEADPSSAAGGYGYGGGGYGGGGYGPAPTSTDTPAEAPTAVASAAGTTHTVLVGGQSLLAFDPPEVSAQPNDVVVFQFQSKNHTVTQSSFAAPCQELSASSTSGQSGFDSGFMPVTAGSSDFPTFSIVVNDTAPIWAYCRQQTPASHCAQGMVFAINAVDDGPKNFTAFQAAARSGSSGGSSGGSSPTSGSTSGAPRIGFSASLALGLGAVFAVLL